MLALKAELADSRGDAKALGESAPGSQCSTPTGARSTRLSAAILARRVSSRREDDINYRRFFNINDLAGLRIEFPPVFDTRMRWSSMIETAQSMGCASTTSTGFSTRRAISRG